MMDLRNHQLMAVAEQEPSFDDLTLKLGMLTLNFQEMLYMILQQLLIHFNCQTAMG